MKTAALLLALLMIGGCVSDDLMAEHPTGSTSSRRHKETKDGDASQQMCQDTSVGGESKTVCY